MEPASLRIKFTPHIQNYQNNNSKCCLEIVPEVSCIQNLERIEWHRQSDFIEYTVPMTYKVILRKRRGLKKSCDDLEKVYHSCVDLLHNSSSTCVNIGCGNTLIRIFSDTLISDSFRAVLSNEMTAARNSRAEMKSVIISNCAKEKQVDPDVVILGKLLDELSNDDNYITNVARDDEYSVTKVDASTSQLFTQDADSTKNECEYKVASTSCDKIHLYKKSNTELQEALTEISANIDDEKSRNSLRKLSVTPIYSIDTIGNEINQNIPLLSPYATLSSLFRPREIVNETIKLYDNYDGKVTNKKVLDTTDYRIIQSRLHTTYKRELPEVRVANFIKKMETEIIPLKIMLHEILQKCTTMGLAINKGFRLKEHPITNKQLIQYCTAEKQTKCNRVVYSIVFDG